MTCTVITLIITYYYVITPGAKITYFADESDMQQSLQGSWYLTAMCFQSKVRARGSYELKKMDHTHTSLCSMKRVRGQL